MSKFPITGKIVKYKLEEDCVNLRKSGLGFSEVAAELNASGKVPLNDPIGAGSVKTFLDKLPEVERALVKGSKNRILTVVNNNFDIISEVSDLFNRSKKLLSALEAAAEDKNKIMNPYQFKAVSSEMRELLRHMTEIQKEVNDYDNVKKFMEIVIQTVKEECPEAIPRIAERLKMTKNTQWFSNMAGGGE